MPVAVPIVQHGGVWMCDCVCVEGEADRSWSAPEKSPDLQSQRKCEQLTRMNHSMIDGRRLHSMGSVASGGRRGCDFSFFFFTALDIFFDSIGPTPACSSLYYARAARLTC